MKITQLMLSKGFGGAERYFVDLSLALADIGFQIQAVCHRDFIKRDELARHPAIHLTTFNVRNRWDLWALHRMTQQVRTFNPDILHAHLARGALMGGRIAHKLGIPLTVKTHNYVDLKYYRYVDYFIATTTDQRDYLTGQGVAPRRIVVIPNFSSLSPVDQPRDHLPVRPTFIALGRMVPKKGFDLLLDAFARYLQYGGQGRLLIGGQGPDHPALVNRADHLGITRQVEFGGWIDEVQTFLARGDIFVLPSRDEPFGIVVLEAMAAGLPIITTRTQGPGEFLDDNTAYFVPIDDSAALADTLKKAIDKPQATLARAHTALDRFRHHYTKEAVLPKLLELYRSMAPHRVPDNRTR